MIGFSEDEAFAAEYVLGTLDAGERSAAAARRESDRTFDELVEQWEMRFAPLVTAAPEVAPSADVFERILVRVGQDGRPAPEDESGTVVVLRRKLRLWRGTAALASALAAMLAIWVAERETTGIGANQTYVAVLQQGSGAPTFVVSLDMSHHRMSVTPLGMNAPPDKSYELWMIGANAQPKSMGLIDAGATMRPAMPDVGRDVMSGATYAVTLEPRGGSPTGQPTSTPLYVGKPINTAL